MAKSSVTIKDRGLRDLLKRLKKQKWELTVGVHGPEGSVPAEGDTDLTVLDVATINEFGIGVPERSFIRDWADQNESSNNDKLIKIAFAVYKGKFTIEIGLNRLGLLFVGDIQRRISGGIPPPNAPATIAKKQSSTPLINFGQLRSSITYVISGGSLGARIKRAAAPIINTIKEKTSEAKKKATKTGRAVLKKGQKTVRKLPKKALASSTKFAKKSIARGAKLTKRASKTILRRSSKLLRSIRKRKK